MSQKRRKQQQLAAAQSLPSVDHFLNRNGVIAFAVFFTFVLWAFWPSYFSRLTSQPDFRLHTHGIAMSLWCILLIAQAWLIRTKQKPLHRTLGKLSYVLVPLPAFRCPEGPFMQQGVETKLHLTLLAT